MFYCQLFFFALSFITQHHLKGHPDILGGLLDALMGKHVQLSPAAFVFCALFRKTTIKQIKMNVLLALTCIVYQGAIVGFISLINLAVSL